MDPVTALTVLCNVLQLIELGAKSAKAFHEICKSKEALTLENERLDQQTKLLSTISSQLSTRLQNVAQDRLTPEKEQLRDLAGECDQSARNLLKRLEKLKVTGPRSKREDLKRWWKSRQEEGKIDEDVKQLEQCRERMDKQMLVNLWYIL